jgi:tetrahydromethanopterin S-methyltransferase subunit G
VDLVQHILENDLHQLDANLKQKLKRETDCEFEKRSIIKDRRDIGTLLGIVVGLLIAILASGLNFNIVAIIGGLLGRVLGYLFKRKLTKANQKVRNLLFGFFESYTSIISRYTENLAMDVNSTRIILEHSLDKYRLPLYLAKEDKSEFVDLLCSFEKILSTTKCYNAINLSWKLFLINCKACIEKDDLATIFLSGCKVSGLG